MFKILSCLLVKTTVEEGEKIEKGGWRDGLFSVGRGGWLPTILKVQELLFIGCCKYAFLVI